MNIVMKGATALLLVIVMLCTTSCGPVSTATTMLETVLTAAETVLPIVASLAGVDPILASKIQQWLQVVSEDVAKATLIIQDTTLTNLQKSEQISALFANSALVVAGLPPELSAVVQTVIAAINAFVSQFGKPAMLSAKYGDKLRQPLTLKKGDKAALANVHRRALALKSAATPAKK